MKKNIISSPYNPGLVVDVDFLKSMHHFVDDDFINKWIVVIGKYFSFRVLTSHESDILTFIFAIRC